MASGLVVAVDRGTAAEAGPSEVETAARSMLQGLEADRAAYRKDPSKVGELVEKYLLPHFDIQYSARSLGKHWADATPAQRALCQRLLSHRRQLRQRVAEPTSDRLKSVLDQGRASGPRDRPH
jgi:phospholipid transport system substrate-binding protein